MVSIYNSCLLLLLSVLFQMTGLVNLAEIKYLTDNKAIKAPNSLNKHLMDSEPKKARDIYVPSYADVTGNCSSENEHNVALNWQNFVLTWYFIKVPEKGRWFLSKVELTLNPSDLFHDFGQFKDDYYTLASTSNDPIFEAPIGNTFGCNKEIRVDLNSVQINMVANLFMRTLIVKPFSDGDEYEKAYVCLATKCRSELLIVTCFLVVVLKVSSYV